MSATVAAESVSLESVGCCPICGAGATILYDGLTDEVCGADKARWTLWQCQVCEAGYLDPRLTPDSIASAYDGYYTHADPGESRQDARLERYRVLARAVNGRLQRRYGVRRAPSSDRMGAALCLVPFMQHFFDPGWRTLPEGRVEARRLAGARLLDVGCGNGAFLAFAAEAGFTALGVDFDEVAVGVARAAGLDVRLGGLEAVDDEAAFQIITLNHVIEHLHDPIDALRRCLDLLAPGGTVLIDTPNLASYGHERYGRHWRGIECPRHLVLFTETSLADALRQAGFTRIEFAPKPFVQLSTYPISAALGREGQGGNGQSTRTRRLGARALAALDGAKALRHHDRSENLTVIASVG